MSKFYRYLGIVLLGLMLFALPGCGSTGSNDKAKEEAGKTGVVKPPDKPKAPEVPQVSKVTGLGDTLDRFEKGFGPGKAANGIYTFKEGKVSVVFKEYAGVQRAARIIVKHDPPVKSDKVISIKPRDGGTGLVGQDVEFNNVSATSNDTLYADDFAEGISSHLPADYVVTGNKVNFDKKLGQKFGTAILACKSGKLAEVLKLKDGGFSAKFKYNASDEVFETTLEIK